MTRRLMKATLSRKPLSGVWRVAAVAGVLGFGGAETARAGLLVEWYVTAKINSWAGDSSEEARAVSCPSLPPCTRASVSLVRNGWEASAYQTPGGWNGAMAEANALMGWDHEVKAAASVLFVVHNTGADPTPIQFQFLINSGRVQMDLGYFIALEDEIPIAQIFALAEAGEQTLWSYQAEIGGRNSGAFLGLKETLVDPQGIGKPSTTLDRPHPGFLNAELSPFGGTLAGGVLGPGESLQLYYYLSATVKTGIPLCNDPEVCDPGNPFAPWVDLFAKIEDPFSIDSGFYLNGQSLASLTAPAAVPEPSTWFLLGAGLAWMAVRMRRAARVPAAGRTVLCEGLRGSAPRRTNALRA